MGRAGCELLLLSKPLLVHVGGSVPGLQAALVDLRLVLKDLECKAPCGGDEDGVAAS